jgi:excisionase family DNA binding protein
LLALQQRAKYSAISLFGALRLSSPLTASRDFSTQHSLAINISTRPESTVDCPSLLRRIGHKTENERVNRKRFKPVKKVSPAPDRELATMAEACALFRVCENTIKRRVAAGEIPGKKHGKLWRFPWARLREIAGVAG